MTFTIDLSKANTREELHDLLQEELPLPEYYGRNLDALYDVLTGVCEPMEIRLLNVSGAKDLPGGYMESFLELCRDVREDNPLVRIHLDNEEETVRESSHGEGADPFKGKGVTADMMKEIRITDIEGFRIGQTEDSRAGTGLTVIISEEGCAAGVDVRGGGPASRECELLRPFSAAKVIHALVLGGGSTFGLDASGGVLKYLEEKQIGYDMGVTHIPQVCQSDIFDLTVGDVMKRPDGKMGYEACVNSEKGNYRDGNYGAGCGATVGKWLGMEHCMKSGIGSAAVCLGDIKLGAIVVVNSIGDIFDPDTGRTIAGMLSEDKKSFRSTEQLMYETAADMKSGFAGNTTIGAILTNAAFDKIQLSKIASMTHNGYARCIRPVHLSLDGDTIYALSSGKVSANEDIIGTLAARVMSRAIVNAVKSAESAYGFPAFRDLPGLE